MDYRIESASKEEWADRALFAEADADRLRAELSTAKECIANLEGSEARLEAELAAAREQVAGAVAAVQAMPSLVTGYEDDGGTGTLEWVSREDVLTFLAKHTADATAALEARDARVRAEERAKVIEEVKDWAISEGAIDNTGEWVSWQIDTLHTDESRKAVGE